MTMRNLHESVSKILDGVDFGAIWRGFERFPFALYDDRTVYFERGEIPYDERFLGNTSIEYDGEFIAIWNAENPDDEDPEFLAANLVHEMFHAFQQKEGETRYPDDLTLLDYPDDLNDHAARLAENKLLVKAVEGDVAALEKFMASRLRRVSANPMVRQEFLAETIEGTAEYAGCRALAKISPEKFAAAIERYKKMIVGEDEKFFDVRRICYGSGTLFFHALEGAGVDFQGKIGGSETPFEIAAKNVVPKSLNAAPDDSLTAAFGEYFRAKKARFGEFGKGEKSAANGEFVICGYDPMNMIKLDGRILCSHFIMLQPQHGGEKLFLRGPVLLDMERNSINRVKKYYTKEN